MAIQKLELLPSREPIAENNSGFYMTSIVWLRWLDRLRMMFNNMVPSVGDDVGDAGTTLTWGKSALTQVFATAIAAPRTVTLSTTGAVNGAKYRIVRQATATGASAISVGGLKNLAVGQWCDVEFNGTAWFLSAFGSL